MSGPNEAAPPPLEEAPAAALPPMYQGGIELASGRPAFVAVPEDIDDFELLSLINGCIRLGDELRRRRAQQQPQPPALELVRAMPGSLRS